MPINNQKNIDINFASNAIESVQSGELSQSPTNRKKKMIHHHSRKGDLSVSVLGDHKTHDSNVRNSDTHNQSLTDLMLWKQSTKIIEDVELKP